jgi:hypothetical protein
MANYIFTAMSQLFAYLSVTVTGTLALLCKVVPAGMLVAFVFF